MTNEFNIGDIVVRVHGYNTSELVRIEGYIFKIVNKTKREIKNINDIYYTDHYGFHHESKYLGAADPKQRLEYHLYHELGLR